MASIRTIFDKLLEIETGKKIIVKVADEAQYETTRTRLVKFWTEHKQVLTAIGADDSDPLLLCGLCADFCKDTNEASFWLGKPRRKIALQFDFYIEGESASSAPPQPSNDLVIPLTVEEVSDDNTPFH